jgi:hypothetical protein
MQNEEELIEQLAKKLDSNPLPISIMASAYAWITVHGIISVGLKHPDVPRSVVEIGERFLESLSACMVKEGFFTKSQMEENLKQVRADRKANQERNRTNG